jgi:hypothetical protein
MNRELDVIESYNLHKKICRSFGYTIDEYLLTKLFAHDESFVIRKCLFHYKLPKNYLHYLIWIHPKHDSRWCYTSVKSLALNFFDKYKLKYIFQNEIKYQSVLSITHYHIILEI